MDGIERIKALAADIKNKPLLKVVDYLLSRTDMNDKYLNEEKSLKQMVTFIRDNAKKQAQDGVAMIEDSTVYNWAIHYWDESNEDLKIKTNKLRPVKEELTEEVEETDTTEEKATTKLEKLEQKKKSAKKDWISEGQLSLFDVM